jgi:hypothetical protein
MWHEMATVKNANIYNGVTVTVGRILPEVSKKVWPFHATGRNACSLLESCHNVPSFRNAGLYSIARFFCSPNPEAFSFTPAILCLEASISSRDRLLAIGRASRLSPSSKNDSPNSARNGSTGIPRLKTKIQ